jgi:hypothetical protein
MDRRSSLKWMLAASAGMPLLARGAFSESSAVTPVAGKGYGTDPDLTKIYRPGDVWPLLLSQPQRRTAAALCDVIIPADSSSPSASSIGVVDFLDEWISAPYPSQKADRPLMLEGLSWIDAESLRRFSKSFAELGEASQHAICDDICYEKTAAAQFASAAKFFARYRDLTAGGFYTSPEGRKDLQYIGNVALLKFSEPPPELLRKLGLDTPPA